jgi:hypothetical protein
MDRDTMRDHVLRGLGFLRGDLDGTVLDRHIDYVYTRDIPNRCNGAARYARISFPLAIGVEEYAYDGAVIAAQASYGKIMAARQPFRINGSILNFFDDPSPFWTKWDEEVTPTGVPTDVLCYSNSVIVRPVPTAIAIVDAHWLVYRDPFGNSGIPELTEAWAVVRGATMYMAHEEGDDDVAARFGALYTNDLTGVSQKYAARYQGEQGMGDNW